MAGAVTNLGVVFDEAGEDFFDDDFFIHPQFRELAGHRLGEFLGSRQAANRLLDFFEW
jgi:hypothetical protein